MNVVKRAVVTFLTSKACGWLGTLFRSAEAGRLVAASALALAAGCSHGGYTDGKRDGMGPAPRDFALAPDDLSRSSSDGPVSVMDFAGSSDLATRPDLASPPDFSMGGGPITGGPCMSGAMGATAFRVRWTDGGGRASVSYEVHGLPDKTRWKVGVFGYNIGFTPQWVDPALGGGGVQLDSSSFIDVELSTSGVSSIASVSLAVYGRSYATGSSGSFNWMTFSGSGATPTNFVSNVAPYRWYAADVAGAIPAGDKGILMRVKAGPSSGSLVVNRLELCINGS